MILVDSSVWIDYFTGVQSKQTDKLDVSLGAQTIAIGDLILTEVLQGFRLDKEYEIAKSLLDELIVFEMLGKEMALKSADNFRILRKKGITIRKTADVIIATFCIDRNIPLLFSDKDFKPFVKHLGLREV
jgi:predicted nucleic acid-binding protein